MVDFCSSDVVVDFLRATCLPSLHRPKSAILTKPSASINRLSSFRSLEERRREHTGSSARSWRLINSPVNDFVLVQELEAEEHAGRVEAGNRDGNMKRTWRSLAAVRRSEVRCRPSLFLREDAGVNVRHQVSSRRVGHHEAHVLPSLEAAMQIDQERVTGSIDDLKDPLFTDQTEHRHTSRNT